MNLSYENQKLKQGFNYIIGCDEVGRGSLAGPVVAAAVVFDHLKIKNLKLKIAGIKDSKQLTSQQREELAPIIKSASLWSIGEVSHEEIDSINIHHASLLAMKRAVEKILSVILNPNASEGEESRLKKEILPLHFVQGQDDAAKMFLFVDGKFQVPSLSISQQAVVEGDGKILSVAAASIIAKVYRDDLMRKLHETHPKYNFAQHKGYATQHHRSAIIEHGLSPIHRLTFCSHLI